MTAVVVLTDGPWHMAAAALAGLSVLLVVSFVTWRKDRKKAQR